MEFSKDETKQILDHGLTPNMVKKQLSHFETGFNPVKIIDIASRESGIMSPNKTERDNYIKNFENKGGKKKIIKFVPASGAATRMFKDLYQFLETPNQISSSIETTIGNINKFAFYNKLSQALKKDNISIEQCIKEKNYSTIFEYLLTEKGLNYGNLPKALIEFHQYKDNSRTALEEHLVEGANYAKQIDNNINLHFTVSQEHIAAFNELIQYLIPKYNKEYSANYNISLSVQKPQTDTIAIFENNKLAKDSKGKLLFRPSGHGALIENLNDLDADIVFIKNIDNISIDKIKDKTYIYKKLLGGILLSFQEKIFNAINTLEKPSLNANDISGIIELCNNLGIRLNKTESQSSEITTILRDKLNRPIRVCGMVKNEGEPGGGPFWVEKNNSISLQIVEKAQINPRSIKQKEIFQKSTHFNPVDIVCGIKDYRGEKFSLHHFIDKEQGFITTKTLLGKEVKVLEVPGLWNGAMAGWISIFVEVPSETFSPVKEINDLLRYQHL